MIPGDRLTAAPAGGRPRRLRRDRAALRGRPGQRRRLAARRRAACSWPRFLLAERTVYLARAVQRLDPVKLLLAQAIDRQRAASSSLSALFEPEPTPLDARPRRLDRLPGRADRRLQLRREPLAAPALPPERAGRRSSSPSRSSACSSPALVAGDPLTPELLLACLAVAARASASAAGSRRRRARRGRHGIIAACPRSPSKRLEVVPNPHPDRDYEVSDGGAGVHLPLSR